MLKIKVVLAGSLLLNGGGVASAANAAVARSAPPPASGAARSEVAGQFEVAGWHLPDLSGASPQLSDGDDPVFGRQSCPALARLNLTLKHSEDLLLKKVLEEHASGSPAVAYRYELRPGLYWWSGKEASAQDLATYLKAELPRLVKERSHGLWTLPSFTTTIDGQGVVGLHFKEKPVFGPYIINGAPFYRPATPSANGGVAFECAGLYRAEPRPFGVALLPTKGYQLHRPLPEIDLYKPGAEPSPKKPLRLDLLYANSLTSTPATRPSDKGAGCSHTVELPFTTLIVWNLKGGMTSELAVRRAFGQLIPRAALVNAGAAQLGEVATSPVPREHPGFNAQVISHPFDIRAASMVLNRLGYRRKTAGSPRLNSQGDALHLVIRTDGASPNLVEKVLADAFSAVGISLQFVAKADDGAAIDGVLAAVSLDWPRVNLIGNFHSGVADAAPFMPPGDKELDRLLDRYAQSVTTFTPDFNILGAVQRRLAELEPMTVLFRQKACLDTGSGLRLLPGSLSQRDPDWFRRLIL